jgi:hypothetical protein
MTTEAAAGTRSHRPRRSTATTLRWVHLMAGLLISVYFMFKPTGGWPDGFESFMANVLVPFVAWTGIIRWQLPRYRRWRAKRRAESLQTPAPGTA